MPEVYLRSLDSTNDQDVQSYSEISDDPLVKEYVNYLYVVKPDFIKSLFNNFYSSDCSELLGVFDASTDKLVGVFHVMDSDKESLTSNLECAYFIGAQYRNLGYCTAALSKIKELYANTKFVSIVFYVYNDNIANSTLLSKLNFIKRRFDKDISIYLARL